jgi:hypothetical protein
MNVYDYTNDKKLITITREDILNLVKSKGIELADDTFIDLDIESISDTDGIQCLEIYLGDLRNEKLLSDEPTIIK